MKNKFEVGQTQNDLIIYEIKHNGTPTIAEALKLCEQAARIHIAAKRYEANAKPYQYKEIRG